MYSKLVATKANRIGSSITVNRVEQSLLRNHLKADTIIHIHVQCLGSVRKFDSQPYHSLSQVVKIASASCGERSNHSSIQLMLVVVHPVITTGAQKGVGPAKIGMLSEFHPAPLLRSLDKSRKQCHPFQKQNPNNIPDWGGTEHSDFF